MYTDVVDDQFDDLVVMGWSVREPCVLTLLVT